MEAFIGWGLTTLLLFLFRKNRYSSSSGDIDSKADDYKDTNANSIGSPVPVVLGRAMVKSPLVSYYGDFRGEVYTEEYGMHSSVSWSDILIPLLIAIIVALITPNNVTVATPAGPGVGTENTQGAKNQMIMMAVFNALMAILMKIFFDHEGRVTIQKGFKYYLGWQHIICWSGKNIGIKSIWMDVYDADIEDCTEKGVWGGNIAWKADNPSGIDV